MTHRKRRTWAGTVIGSAALAAVTLLAVQGCAPATPAAADTPAAHGLTIATARAVYRSYLTASDAAAAAGNETLGLSIVASAQWSLVKSQYTARLTTGTAVPRYRYGTPVFYVPALASYPQWFVVAVPRRAGTGGAAVNTLLLFDRRQAGQPWMLNGSAVLHQPLPAIALESDGYAIGVPGNDPSLLLRPDVAGATQAAVVDEGPANPATTVVQAGSQTTGLYAALAAQATADMAEGLQYQWLLEGASYPQFQLRTRDGGALVLYGMSLDTTTEHPNLAKGPPIRVPADVAALFTLPHEIGYHGLWADWTYQFAALDPPSTAHNAKLQIIGWQGAPTYGHAA